MTDSYLSPDKAARDRVGHVLGDENGYDGTLSFDIWDAEFTRRFTSDEYPGVLLVRGRAPFKGYRCGFINSSTGERVVMDVVGELLYDDQGEYLGGICWCHNLQPYSDYLSEQHRQLLASHETICNLMPHLVWTSTCTGICDYCSDGWYTFTGMSKEQALQEGWMAAIHPDDLPAVEARWDSARRHPKLYEVEARCKRHDGVYKWMLIRAMPLRDKDSNKVLKWYGTNTDVHDHITQRIEAARNKDQILTVLAHSEVNLFSIDEERKLSLMEGSIILDYSPDKSSLVGTNFFHACQLIEPGGLEGI
jgi:PAS domain S-box-containing protein